MTSLTRHDPFDDFFRGFFVRPVEMGDVSAEAPAIRIDVSESSTGYLVQAEIPGVRKEDIHVNIDGATVAVRAERRQEKEAREGGRVLRTERYFGKVSRNFQLPAEIDEALASAKFTDGVLELTLPKKAAVQARRLTIQ